MTKQNTEQAQQACAMQVLYDGSCPLCLKEIGLYQSLKSESAIEWVDVSSANAALPAGADRKTLMARFHVVEADGTLTQGAAAFVSLWAQFPGWRHLSRFGRLPGVTVLLELVYRFFLVIRPAMQWIARRMKHD